MRKTLSLAAVLLGLLVAGRRALAVHGKALLLLTQELPQSPLKPLTWLTLEPRHESLRLVTPHGAVVADLFVPAPRGRGQRHSRHPAMIVAFGMALHQHDRPVLLGFARTMARLGFVTCWPRLETLDAGSPLPEEPDTFVAAVEHLAGLPSVDGERVSLFGFSVGASAALVAASDARVAGLVRAVVFFGGYYDLFAYIVGAATGSMVVDGARAVWQPTPEVRKRLLPMLTARGADGVRQVFEAPSYAAAEAGLQAAPPAERAALSRLNPAEHVAGLRARVFVLHDRGDAFVPFVESAKLRQALPAERVGAFLLTDIFEHAQPRAGLSWSVLLDIVRLYRFVYTVLRYL